MNNILYKDDKYELFYNETEMYIIINGDEYEISYHPYEPNTYITSKDKSINIIKLSWFYPGDIVESFQNNEKVDLGKDGQFSPLEFCEMIKNEILKERAKIKQEIVKETCYKTSSFTGN